MAKRRNANAGLRTHAGSSAFQKWRVKQGISLRALARRTRLSASTLCRIEQGRPVTMLARIRLKDSLRLSTHALNGLLGPLQFHTQQPKAGLPQGRFHKWRLRHNLTLKDLAAKTGLSVATLSRLETGTVQLHKRTLQRIKATLTRLQRAKLPKEARRGKIQRGH